MKTIKYEEMTFSNIPEEKEIASINQFCLDYELFSKKSLDVFKKADKYTALSIPVVLLISCIITTAASFVLFPTEAPVLTDRAVSFTSHKKHCPMHKTKLCYHAGDR